jgi:hypothetical protein
VIAAGIWMIRRQSAAPAAPARAPAAVSPAAAISGERTMPAGCDPLPKSPPLPAALETAAPTVEAVVQALDASLTEDHKSFLRCFPDEEDLVARVHLGFGRWLRNALHLWSTTPLTTALRAMGVTRPDDMSTVIIRAYARQLRHAPLNLPDAVARTRAMAETLKK